MRQRSSCFTGDGTKRLLGARIFRENFRGSNFVSKTESLSVETGWQVSAEGSSRVEGARDSAAPHDGLPTLLRKDSHALESHRCAGVGALSPQRVQVDLSRLRAPPPHEQASLVLWSPPYCPPYRCLSGRVRRMYGDDQRGKEETKFLEDHRISGVLLLVCPGKFHDWWVFCRPSLDFYGSNEKLNFHWIFFFFFFPYTLILAFFSSDLSNFFRWTNLNNDGFLKNITVRFVKCCLAWEDFLVFFFGDYKVLNCCYQNPEILLKSKDCEKLNVGLENFDFFVISGTLSCYI